MIVKERTLRTLHTLSRMLLGIVFVFSGFVKAIDPIGFSYKIEEYLRVAHIPLLPWLNLPFVASVLLISVEFVLGMYLVLGIRRKFCAVVTLFLVAIFTLISVVLALFHPVADCGCFGDFIVLTDVQTLLKNIVLLILAISFYYHHKMTISFVPVDWHWFFSLYTCVFILFFTLRSLYYLPLMDFRPYNIGTNLREAVFPKNIEEDKIPLDFYVTDTIGMDYTANILLDKRAVFLVICPQLKNANISVTEELNAINDWCIDHDCKMYCLTSSPISDINEWSYNNDIQFPFLLADNTMLKTMIRSNPGLILLDDGVIRNKWSCNNLPKLSGNMVTMGQIEVNANKNGTTLLRILLWYIIPMCFSAFIAHAVDLLKKRSQTRNNKLNVKP